MMASSNSPLVEMAMTYVNECEKKILPEQKPRIREAFAAFINGRISYQECSGQLAPIIGTTQPVDKIDAILRTPDQPLPTMQMKQFEVAINQMRAKTRPWTTYEDQRLLAGLHRFGFDDWSMISQFVGNGRTKAQCSQRWARGLDPKINKDQWSEAQDSKLLQLVSIHGDKSWTRIATQMGNRCDVQCRYRYRQLMKDSDFHEKMARATEEAKLNSESLSAEPKAPKAPRPRQSKHHPQTYQPPVYPQMMYFPQQMQVPVMMQQPPMGQQIYMQPPMQQQILIPSQLQPHQMPPHNMGPPQNMTAPPPPPQQQMPSNLPSQGMNQGIQQNIQQGMNQNMNQGMNQGMQQGMNSQSMQPQNMNTQLPAQNMQNGLQGQMQNQMQNQMPANIPGMGSQGGGLSGMNSVGNLGINNQGGQSSASASGQINPQISFAWTDEISAQGSLADWNIKSSPSGAQFGIPQNGSRLW